jgi:XTP/dITP diphosphohydrolase
MRAGYRDTLVVATSNRGKLEELRGFLASLPLEAKPVDEILRDPPLVVEDGATFEENATKKAVAMARATMMATLADDSGLEIDALGGRPGVRSARFAHERATDAENNAAVLAALAALHEPAAGSTFRARFRCVLVLVDPYTCGGTPQIAHGTCEGAVIRAPRGAGGFGYDPLFVVDGSDRTMAELTTDEKKRVSHRARAFDALRPALARLVALRAEQTAAIAFGG